MSRILIVLVAALALAGVLFWIAGSSWTPRGAPAEGLAAPRERVEQAPPAALEAPEGSEDDEAIAAEEPSSREALRPSAALTLGGVVKDVNGAALADVALWVEAGGPRWKSVKRARTTSASDGTFQLVATARGKVRICATLEGYELGMNELEELERGAARHDLVIVLAPARAIAGVVRWLDGRPAEADIQLKPLLRGELRGEILQGESDASGAFAIRGLSADSYRVTARSRDGRGVAEIEEGKTGTTDLVLTLTRGVPFAGRVVDERGMGVADFNFECWRIETNRGRHEADVREFLRDTDGSFALDGFLPGAWNVSVTSQGHAFVERRRVFLPASAPVEFVLAREVRVSGIVLDPEEKPVAGASVQAGRKDNLYLEVGGHQTDAQGRFEIGRLGPGPVSLAASGAGFAPGDALTLELTAGQTITGIVLRFGLGGTITGELVGADGSPQARRSISLQTHDSNASTRTDGDGRFRFAGVRGEVEVSGYTQEGVEVEGRVTVNAGETVHVRLAAPSSLVRLHGRVEAGGEPLGNGSLTAKLAAREGNASGRPSFTQIDWDGTYELALTEPGRYELTVHGGDAYLCWNATVEVPDVPAFELDVRIPVGRISGRVTDAAGTALPGIPVRTFSGERDGLPNGSAARTDAQGSYELRVPVGSCTVIAGGSGEDPREGARCYVEARVDGLVVIENGELRHIDLKLEEGGILEGMVRNADGSPAPRAVIWHEDGGQKMLGMTDDEGRFHSRGVPVGTRLVGAHGHTGETREPTRVEIVAGETRRIELTLARK